MSRLAKYAVSVLILIVAGVAAVACGGEGNGPASSTPGSSGGTRTDDGGQVTVKATWDGSLRPLVFRIALDTHSVDLDGYDLTGLATLRIDGEAELKPISWDASKGGHHREGTLSFESAEAGSGPFAAVSSVELIVRGIGGKAERVLRWDIAKATT